MNKKTLIIIAVVVVLVLGLSILYSTLTRERIFEEEVTPREFLPFGRPPEVGEMPEVVKVPQVIIPPEEIEEVAVAKLQQIALFGVAGFIVFEKTRPLEPGARSQELEAKIDFTGYPVLRLNDEEPEVTDLKKILNKQVLSPELELTEIFDDATHQAVIDFQTKEGLAADGIVGSKTFAALNEFQGIVEEDVELATAVRYVEKASGHVYEQFLDEQSGKRVSLTTIPRIHEALLSGKGDSVILRYVADDNQTIETFSGEIIEGPEGQAGELVGSFFPQNITELIVSPDKEKIFYIAEINGGIAGITSSFDGSGQKQVLDSPFTEWNAQWPAKNKIFLATKPSGVVAGYLYILSTQTKRLDKVLGGIIGLTALASPSGELVLYSHSDEDNVFLNLYNRDEKTQLDLEKNTLPEKCVWAGDEENVYCAVPKFIEPNIYPDLWYQGMVSFSDSIWRINTATGLSDLILDPAAEVGEEMDIIKPALSPDENYLLFVDKKDNILWSYKL